MTNIYHFLLDLIFPCRCVSCKEPVLTSMNHLCTECRGKMKPLREGCPVCSGIISEGACVICGSRKYYPEKSISLFEYEKVSRSLIHSMKFEGIRDVYKIFVPRFCETISVFSDKIDIVSYVPMNRRKVLKRGYNQSKLIAGETSRIMKKGFCTVLKEKRNTVRQRDLNYNDRFINVIDRYQTVNNNKFRNKNILLIDDVFTTGATVNECSRMLIMAGAAKVFAITAVRADIKKLENI